MKKHQDFPEYVKSLESIAWQRTCRDTGLDRELIEKIANICANSKSIISCWAMGLTQHKNGVALLFKRLSTSTCWADILVVKGAGLCPVRGHSNVQGNRTVGDLEAQAIRLLKKMGLDSNA